LNHHPEDLRGLEDLKGHSQPLLFFLNREDFDLNHLPEDLRGLEDLKGHSQPLLFFLNSEGFGFIHHPDDLRGLEDLKGGPQRSENSEGFIFSSKFAKKAHPYSEPDSLTRTS
jgi:hypothetical protein